MLQKMPEQTLMEALDGITTSDRKREKSSVKRVSLIEYLEPLRLMDRKKFLITHEKCTPIKTEPIPILVELVLRIMMYLSQADYRQMRLASKQLLPLATVMLFHRVKPRKVSSFNKLSDGDRMIVNSHLSLVRQLDLSQLSSRTILVRNETILKLDSRLFQNLMALNLSDCQQLTDEALTAILLQTRCIRQLHLNGCSLLTDAWLQNCHSQLQDLVALSLNKVYHLTDDGLLLLAHHSPRLQKFCVSHAKQVSFKSLLRIYDRCSIISLSIAKCGKFNQDHLLQIAQKLSQDSGKQILQHLYLDSNYGVMTRQGLLNFLDLMSTLSSGVQFKSMTIKTGLVFSDNGWYRRNLLSDSDITDLIVVYPHLQISQNDDCKYSQQKMRESPSAPQRVDSSQDVQDGMTIESSSAVNTPIIAPSDNSAIQSTPNAEESANNTDLLRIMSPSCRMLKLSIHAECTALFYYHRYKQFTEQKQQNQDSRFKNISESLILTVCIILACKSTEEHRKSRDVIGCVYKAMYPDEQFMKINEQYFKIRDSCTKVEFILLRVLGFNMQVELPHVWIMRICKVMMQDSVASQMVCQIALSIANAAYHQNVCILPKLPGHTHDQSATQSPTVQGETVGRVERVKDPADSQHYTVETRTIARVLALSCAYIAMRSLQLDLPIDFNKFCTIWSGRKAEEVEECIRTLTIQLQQS
ncbi:hypothetical protein MP228_007886 [Amoeboaphelidium protococcarum]|nr:hypothetical protein MP228_007886 [Amoeboaphelidium protococcarum]